MNINKIINNSGNILTKRTKSLGTQFLMLMNIVIFITVISMAFYYFNTAQKMSELSQIEKDFNTKAVANLVFETARIDINTKNYSRLKSITKNLVQNNIISYVIIIDKKNNIINWASNSNLINTFFSSKTFLLFGNDNIKIISGDTKTHTIIIGYESLPALSSFINSMIENNKIFALTFLFIGFVFAILMGRIVTEPVKKLASGANILSNGNLKHKIEKTQYKELNILVDAFNEMAQKLDNLYASLEEKVKERTQEVVEKNNELQKAYKELKEAQSIMVHSEKMRSLGELVAGITHEINNPVNFIYGNLIHLNNYSRDLINIIEKYQQFEENLSYEQQQEIKQLKENLEYSFIKNDLPDLIKSCKEGTERTKNIIIDLKSFSRADEMIINEIDVHKELNTALNILFNKHKDRIHIHKEFGELPKIDCYGGQINQVFLNVLDNAIFAIKKEGDIFLRTRMDDKFVIIEIEDTGIGITPENIKKIFEPFFTTKSVGDGTGLGMSISYKIIENHNGIIDVESQIGKGTKFTIKLLKEGVRKQVVSKE
ncbi:MAG: ATP-binding protein [Candidatus Gastranaerophilaceae bacterium]|jgi:signal transduction histidine kinase